MAEMASNRQNRQPSGDFCQNRQFRQNRHFRQNRQPRRGHFWHPIQIASGWRFFASFAIFAIACISGHKCEKIHTRFQTWPLGISNSRISISFFFVFFLWVLRVRGQGLNQSARIFFIRAFSGCYAILTSPKEGETAVYGYNPALF